MNNVIERMRRGDLITHDDPDYPALWQEFEKTRALVAELNGKYHTPDEITSLLSQIWGQEDLQARMFPPFYTAFGKNTRVGKGVFINFGCTFLDQGGITIEDDVQIAANVQLLSNNHDPYDRQVLTCRPVRICKGAWIGAGASILPGVTVGRHAIVGAASVVTHDVGDYEVVAGNPAKCIRKLDPDRFPPETEK
jgi:acetyltransferase-like isoleucine patch superfamily enzyme